jgi:hypothetical protein
MPLHGDRKYASAHNTTNRKLLRLTCNEGLAGSVGSRASLVNMISNAASRTGDGRLCGTANHGCALFAGANFSTFVALSAKSCDVSRASSKRKTFLMLK